MNTYYGWTPPPAGGFIPPQQNALRRDAGFIGAAFLLMLGMLQTIFSLILTALAMAGAANLQAADGRYGLGNVGFLAAYGIAYALIMGLPGPLTAAFSRRRINPFANLEDAEKRPLGFLSILLALLGGMAVCVLANFATSYLLAFLGRFGIRQPELPSYMDNTAVGLCLNILIFAVLPGILEEMLFRGYFLRLLRPYGTWFAVIVTAILFALMHGNILQIPFAFLVGLACGWLTVRSGRVWPAMMLHFLNNFMAEILEFAGLGQTEAQSQKTLLIVFSVVGILGLICLMILFARNDPLVRKEPESSPALPLGARVKTLLTTPAFLIGGILSILLTVLSVITTQLGAAS